MLGTPRGARDRDVETLVLKEFAVHLGDTIANKPWWFLPSQKGLDSGVRRKWGIREAFSEGCCLFMQGEATGLACPKPAPLNCSAWPTVHFSVTVSHSSPNTKEVQQWQKYSCSQAHKIMKPTPRAHATNKCTDGTSVCGVCICESREEMWWARMEMRKVTVSLLGRLPSSSQVRRWEDERSVGRFW